MLEKGTLPWWRRAWLRIVSLTIRRQLILPSPKDFKDDTNSPRALLPPGPGQEQAEPELLPQDSISEEDWLDTLVTDASEGRRIHEVCGEAFWGRIDALGDAGDEMLASQWMEKFLQLEILGEEPKTLLQLRIVKFFDERGDLRPALEHLEALKEHPEHATDAHYYLAEHFRQIGDEVRALREYEALLARDMEYPNVRQRYQRLRDARGGSAAPAAAGETMVGAGSAGATDGNRYLLVRELGRGAAGVVYLARDMQLQREVAVKLLHPHMAAADQQHALQAFFDEARIAASLRHPNIVAILDLDEKARRIVMELCDGGTLHSVLRDRGPRPMLRALERHAQILSALEASHARGVVHRDLKPANLMFRRDPDLPGAEIVLGDFGIAHLPDEKGKSGKERAIESQAVGTIAYMSPEQRRGEAIPASDLYASAVVLFEMLTGRYPWSRDQLLAGERHASDFALPQSLHDQHPQLGIILQAHLDALGAPSADLRPTTISAMKESRHIRDLAMVQCA